MPKNETTTLLSIVIVNYNTPELVYKCLISVKNFAGKINFEVILIDNGSDIASRQQFESIKRESFWKERLTIIYNDKNEGYAKANNIGVNKSHGKYILLLNSDTLVRKGSLEKLINFAYRTPDAGVVAPKLLNIDGSVQTSCYNFPSISNALKESWLGKKGLLDGYAPTSDVPIAVDGVVGAAFLITPQALRKVGLLDERYFAYFEDIDYCRRVWKRGLKVYYIPESTITHIKGATFSKLASYENRWRKLVPGSKIYNGFLKHYIIFGIMWSGQKFKKFTDLLN